MSEIDWMKPVYDVKSGVELFALRGPDGRPFFDRNGGVVVVNLKSGGATWADSDASGFTNTPPVRDWAMTKDLAHGPDRMTILYGREDGELFVRRLQ